MIGNRSQGLRLLSHAFIVLYMLALFSIMMVIGVHWMNRLNYDLFNTPLYFFGVFVAGLLCYNSPSTGSGSDLSSFRWVNAIRRTNYQFLILAAVLFAIAFTTKDRGISRLFLGSFLALFWCSSVPLNRFIPEWIAGIAFRGSNSVRTIFLGSAKSAHQLESWARRQPFFGIEIIGLVTYEMATETNLKMPVIGEFMDLEDVIAGHRVDQVVLLETRNSDWWVDSVVETCGKAGCRILIFNPWEEYFDQELTPVYQGGHTFFTLQPEPLENPLNRVLKRALDILISLPVVLFILPMLCLLVKFFHLRQSKGPLFFLQGRSGQRGREFKIYKFRTMHDSGEDRTNEAKQATRGDSRIFPFGQVMRRTSIDEFPQFINVLKGQMSVIGPRPHLLKHDVAFSDFVDIYRTRHFVKPGITGLAQCRGFRGEVTDPKLIEERVRYDLEYIRGWSLWLDVWILLRTLVQIFRPPRTAY
ncbi:exopolysaccharide biosynthesis polyprenyl glycosylphosphotransferase [Coraliomargarita parva]|uniref:exopolysaccharide biosynthesis polyprenyl glycosylphosphotransferase n=1 Tax=Coraliomargarita parva TaxID=3014050 RepID=UPI0022B5D18F|nr:exopolysaccharide biosynthesis polyprenyl glycosylphosphotransferase [Coraliomargarita parva]